MAKRWTAEEDQIFRDNYPTMGKNVYKLLPNRDEESCKARAKTLRIKFNKRSIEWTPEEEQILIDNYHTMKGRVVELLPGRSENACCQRASLLGIAINKKIDQGELEHFNKWTPDEDQILRDNYPTMGSKVAELLSKRTEFVCYRRAKLLGIKVLNNKNKLTNASWSSEEEQILRDNYPTMGSKVAELLPGRTGNACKDRACLLKIKLLNINNSRSTSWTPEEDQILRDNYPTMGEKVSELLPGRTESACKFRACLLKVVKLKLDNPNRKWTPEEDKILMDNYPSMGKDVVKLLLGRTEEVCIKRFNSLREFRIWLDSNTKNI